VRWKLVTALARSDRRGQDLARLVRRPPNLVSYHLRQLFKHKLVAERRSAADQRDVYFSLRLDAVRALFAESGEALHPALAQCAPEAQPTPAADLRPVRVLFLCTHNSARSQMAEAILRHLGGDAVVAFSAGTAPGDIHPLARQTMRARGIAMDGQRSKHLDEYAERKFDYVVTVCDLARETCPIFPGSPEQIHWSLPDPAAVAERKARLRAFERTATELTTRINHLLQLINRPERGERRR
jgi:ArsR family transcriptional regulator, arsenate/arsenite/antimonite-responsive transcriptional repressor / arsenate reductase (thioredoxin)